MNMGWQMVGEYRENECIAMRMISTLNTLFLQSSCRYHLTPLERRVSIQLGMAAS